MTDIVDTYKGVVGATKASKLPKIAPIAQVKEVSEDTKLLKEMNAMQKSEMKQDAQEAKEKKSQAREEKSMRAKSGTDRFAGVRDAYNKARDITSSAHDAVMGTQRRDGNSEQIKLLNRIATTTDEILKKMGNDKKGGGGGLLGGLLSMLGGGIKNMLGKALAALLGAGALKSILGKVFKGGASIAGKAIKGAGSIAGKVFKGAGAGIGKIAGKLGGLAGAAGGVGALAKGGLKTIGKAIPGVGLALGLGFGAKRLMNGDPVGALGEVASGIVGLLPGLGTAASVAISAGLIARDAAKANEVSTTESIGLAAKAGMMASALGKTSMGMVGKAAALAFTGIGGAAAGLTAATGTFSSTISSLSATLTAAISGFGKKIADMAKNGMNSVKEFLGIDTPKEENKSGQPGQPAVPKQNPKNKPSTDSKLSMAWDSVTGVVSDYGSAISNGFQKTDLAKRINGNTNAAKTSASAVTSKAADKQYNIEKAAGKTALSTDAKTGGIRIATGAIDDGAKAAGQSNGITLAGGAHVDGMNPDFMNAFYAMAGEHYQQTKKKIVVNSAYRTNAEQAKMHKEDPKNAAPPGNSMHERGLAIDMNTPDADRLIKLGLMDKYGFFRPLPSETWHVEMRATASTRVAITKGWKPGQTEAGTAQVGKGGGGGSPAATPTGSLASPPSTASTTPAEKSGNSKNVEPVVAGKSSAGVTKSDTSTNGKEVSGYITESAKKSGTSEAYMRGVARMEGGINGAVSPTGAIGVGQFTKGTWNGTMKNHPKEAKEIGMTPVTSANEGKPNDPRFNKRVNSLAMGILTKENAARFKKDNGRDATDEDLYMMHNTGDTKAHRYSRTEMDANGGKGMTYQEFDAMQRSKFRANYNAANGINGGDGKIDSGALKGSKITIGQALTGGAVDASGNARGLFGTTHSAYSDGMNAGNRAMGDSMAGTVTRTGQKSLTDLRSGFKTNPFRNTGENNLSRGSNLKDGVSKSLSPDTSDGEVLSHHAQKSNSELQRMNRKAVNVSVQNQGTPPGRATNNAVAKGGSSKGISTGMGVRNNDSIIREVAIRMMKDSM